MGYDEAIVNISQQYGVSWTPFAWKPESTGGVKCQDINSENDGTTLATGADGKGADWETIWNTYANTSGPEPAGTIFT